MKKVLLFGGAGFIGSNVAIEFVNNNYNVHIFDLMEHYCEPHEINYQTILDQRFKDIRDKVLITKGDNSDFIDVNKAINTIKPEIIVSFSAIPIVKLCNIRIDEAYSSLLTSVKHTLQTIKDSNNLERFVYISSSTIYGDFEYDPVDEDHPKHPKGVYAGTKLAGEILTESFSRQFNIPYSIVRPSAVYGPTDVNKRVVQLFIESALKGKKLILKDPNSRLDFSYVKDVARGIYLAATHEKAKSETFNITCGQGRSLKELVSIIEEYIPNLILEEGEFDKDMPRRGALDISKAKSLMGYNPEYNLEKGVAEYIKFVKDNS